MRLVLLTLYAAMTAALLIGSVVRISFLLSEGEDLEWWVIGAGVLGLLALLALLAAGPSLRRPRRR